MRLGLANLPVMLAVEILSFPAFILLLVIKIAGQAVISGTLFSYVLLFSSAGTIASGLAMYSLKKLKSKNIISFLGISTAGAFFSNSVQIVLAYFFVFGQGIVYITPPMLIIGLMTSFFLGMFANKFAKDSLWYKNIFNKKSVHDYSFAENKKYTLTKNFKSDADTKKLNIYFRYFAGFFLTAALLFVNLPQTQAVIFGAALILCTAEKVNIKFGFLIFTFICIVIFNLYPPHGKILYKLSIFTITDGALLKGIQKAVVLEGMVYISKWVLKDKNSLRSFGGKTVSSSLFVFQKLMSVKHEIKPRNIIPTLDSVLLSFEKLKPDTCEF